MIKVNIFQKMIDVYSAQLKSFFFNNLQTILIVGGIAVVVLILVVILAVRINNSRFSTF